MAVRSGMFQSVNGDRKYKSEHFAEYFATFIANGIFPIPSTGFQVVEHENMIVSVLDGKGWINGYYAVNEGRVLFTLTNADGVLNRIDRIVLRFDNNDRIIDIDLKQGAFATNPVAPILQRDADSYELALADIYIGKGVTAILQGNITDLRLNKDLCGIVHGLVNQVDTTTIFNQYQSWFEQMTGEKLESYDNWFAQHQREFNDWFATIVDILDTNVAGNLQNQITALQDHTADLTSHSIYKLNKDMNDIFTEIQLMRADGTLYMKSILSGGDSPNYSTRTETYYKNDGITVTNTITYSRSYDDTEALISEVKT